MTTNHPTPTPDGTVPSSEEVYINLYTPYISSLNTRKAGFKISMMRRILMRITIVAVIIVVIIIAIVGTSMILQLPLHAERMVYAAW